jgi:hypothetical protein
VNALSYARIILWGHTLTYPLAHAPVTTEPSWRLAVQMTSVLAVPLVFECLAWADRRRCAPQSEGVA